ncbi:hypothetical protein [Nocardia abscessus]|uniref:hypothetical protein n=1 Tax=Nocardia abscessus TaxID=120957 RepID=UPI002454CCF9|nr:hypothetical protein [Nocardia abscessus]
MNTSHLDHRRQGGRRAAIVIAALILVAACSAQVDDFGEHDQGPGVPSGATIRSLPPLPTPWHSLDRHNPAAVAISAVQAVFDWHPERGDTGPQAAAHRAAPLFTPRAAESYRHYPIPRPTWQVWMDTATTITATTVIGTEQHPVDTDASWHRKTSTTLTITTPGEPPATLSVISLVTLQKQPVWVASGLAHSAAP